MLSNTLRFLKLPFYILSLLSGRFTDLKQVCKPRRAASCWYLEYSYRGLFHRIWFFRPLKISINSKNRKHRRFDRLKKETLGDSPRPSDPSDNVWRAPKGRQNGRATFGESPKLEKFVGQRLEIHQSLKKLPDNVWRVTKAKKTGRFLV